jgi:hypothetical protein
VNKNLGLSVKAGTSTGVPAFRFNSSNRCRGLQPPTGLFVISTSIRQPFINFITIIKQAIKSTSTIKFFAPLRPDGKNIFHSFIQTKALKFARRL